MKSRFRIYTYIYILLCCKISCNKEAPQGSLDWHTATNTNENSQRDAKGLEIPRLDPSNLFNRYATDYNGKETATFSIEYDKKKRHSKWVAFTFDNNTSQVNWNRNNWGKDPFQPDPLLPNDIRIGDEEHEKDLYDRGTFAPRPTASTPKMQTSTPSTTLTKPTTKQVQHRHLA